MEGLGPVLAAEAEDLTPDQVIGVVTQHHSRINWSVAHILELFNWYTSARMHAVIGHFDRKVD